MTHTDVAIKIINDNKQALEFFFDTLKFVDLEKVRTKVLLQMNKKLFFDINSYANGSSVGDYTIFDSKYNKCRGYDEIEGFRNDFLFFIQNQIVRAFDDAKDNDQYQGERG